MPTRGLGPNILIAGSYGMGNTGDDAILAAMLEQLRSRLPDACIEVVAGNCDYVRERFGAQAVAWDDWAEIMQAARKAALIIQGGGGLFFNYSNFDAQRLFENGAPDLCHYGTFSLLAGLLDKRFMIWGAGVGPLHTPASRDMVRLAFSLAHSATVRDDESLALLEEIGADEGSVEVTADPAFAMQRADDSRAWAILAEHEIHRDRPLVGVVLRPWDTQQMQSNWEASVAHILASFAGEKNARLLLIPFHPGYDDVIIGRVQEALGDSDVAVLRGSYTPAEIAAVVGQCDLVVGMRLHAVLFSVLAGVPAVGLVYADKVRSLLRRIGREDLCVGLNALEAMGGLLRAVWESRADVSETFSRAARELGPLAERNAELACALLRRPSLHARSGAAFRLAVARALEGRLKDIRARDYELRTWAPRAALEEVQAMRAGLAQRDDAIAALRGELEALRTELSARDDAIRDLKAALRGAADQDK